MVTFNVDSLDFEDDEELRTGTDSDFATRYSSEDSRLEVADIANGTVGRIPRGTSTDLVGGKFAETVSEGKILTDDGTVNDTFDEANQNATSWMKVGPGYFKADFFANGGRFDQAGLTVIGSGRRTVIDVTGGAMRFNADNQTFANLRVTNGTGIDVGVVTNGGLSVENVYVDGASGDGVRLDDGNNNIVVNCTIESTDGYGIFSGGNNNIIAQNNISDVGDSAIRANTDISNNIIVNNNIKNTGGAGITANDYDGIVIANHIKDASVDGIYVGRTDHIIANNRIIGYGRDGINTSGTSGTELDGNLITE